MWKTCMSCVAETSAEVSMLTSQPQPVLCCNTTCTLRDYSPVYIYIQVSLRSFSQEVCTSSEFTSFLSFFAPINKQNNLTKCLQTKYSYTYFSYRTESNCLCQLSSTLERHEFPKNMVHAFSFCALFLLLLRKPE